MSASSQQRPGDAAARRAALLAAKLAALVRDEIGVDTPIDVAGFGGGAGAVVDGSAWVLLDEHPDRSLGGAIAWTIRRGAGSLRVLAERGTGVLARRAEMFTLPIQVVHVDGRARIPAIAEPLPSVVAAPDRHLSFREVIEAGGARPVEEHGILIGEVHGLEVCRVVDDPVTGDARLEVGVGAHDRETFQMLHGDRPTVEALADVVRSVTEHRSVGAPQHPLNLLAASRLLRSRLIERPELLHAASIRAVEPPVPRANVKDQTPCVAIATVRAADGGPSMDVPVVCTTGIDLEVVPWATDVARVYGQDRVWIAAPARDVIDIQERLAALARVPFLFRPIASD